MKRDEAKITSKGQITVPKQVRIALGVEAGDSLVFERDGSEIKVRPAKGKGLFSKYRGIGNTGFPSGRDAINREIRQLRGHDDNE